MYYYSTRNKTIRVSGAEAIVKGLSPDGGLFIPERIPVLNAEEQEELLKLDYPHLAARIMSLYLTDFSEEELLTFTKAAYGPGRFDSCDVAPLRKAGDVSVLELWHGPTCAFKDMALQILPYLLTASAAKCGETAEICILVATSGDTGKAALEGFRDIPGTRIMVFYPRDGVSDVQKLQMISQAGGNVNVVAVNGNFDDAQSGVKEIFSDASVREKLLAANRVLSSANSINWGRLLPQIVYYVWTCLCFRRGGRLTQGQTLDFSVPTGNFGDILAGWYARRMGLPIGKLICASNSNDVLTDFIRTGVYDRNRSFRLTVSPSMDILISSNLERLLASLSGDLSLTASYMEQLRANGRYQISDEVLRLLQAEFSAERVSEEETFAAIRSAWETEGYLLDPHSAVGYAAALRQRRPDTPVALVSTASPYKFSAAVLHSLGAAPEADGFASIDRLQEITGIAAPIPIRSLRGSAVRFTEAVDPSEMRKAVLDFLR